MKIGLVRDKLSRWYIGYMSKGFYHTFLSYYHLNEGSECNWKEDMKNYYIGSNQRDNILENKLWEAKDGGFISDFIVLENDNEIKLIKDIEEFILLQEII